MQICVCGWYYPDEFYMALYRIKEKYPVTIIGNRFDERLKNWELTYFYRENTGLEWGAYNYYLQRVWKGGNVLFMHDDVILGPVMKSYEIVKGEVAFDKVANLTCDQAFIFQNRHQDVTSGGIHGRMVYMSDRFLTYAKQFWYDPKNTGYTGGERPPGAEHFNAGISHYRDLVEASGLDCNHKIYIPSIKMGNRGNHDT